MPDVVGMYRSYGVRLRAVSETSEWATVRCFAGVHEDRHPSARVHLRSGGFRCFTCGAAGGALAALELLGVRDPDERVRVAVDHGILDKPIKPRPRAARAGGAPAAVPSPAAATQQVDYDQLAGGATAALERSWVYLGAAGEPVGRVKRLDLPAGKRVWQERPDGPGWLPGLNGALLPLYRLPEVLEHAAAGQRVLIVEGEKACDALDRLGLFATTNAGGAGKWRDDHTAALAGASVVAIADSDLAGRLHTVDVTSSALAAGVDARMPLDLGELRDDGYDVVDYLAAVAETARAVNPNLPAGELRDRLRRKLEYELARQLPATPDSLQRFVERARYTADPAGKALLTCGGCDQERPQRVTHGFAFCPCGSHQVAP